MKRLMLVLMVFIYVQLSNAQNTPYQNACEYYRIGDYSKAWPLFADLLKEYPEYAPTYYYRGKMLVSNDQKADALQEFELAQKYCELTDVKLLANIHLEKGKIYWQTADEELALLELNIAIELDSTMKDPYLIRAQTLIELKKYDEAERDYRYLIKLDKDGAMYYEGLGRVLTHQKRYEEAELNFNKSVQLDPSDQWQYFYRGILYSQQLRHKEAIDDFIKFYNLDFDTSTFDIFAEIALNDLQYAVQQVDAQTTPKTDKTAMWFSLKETLLYKAKDYIGTAGATIKIIENMSEPDANTYERAALALSLSDLYNREVVYHEEALRLDSTIDVNYHVMGTTYFELKNWKRAIYYFTKAIELDSTDYIVLNSRARAYSKLGDYKSAIADFNKSIELDSANYIALLYRGRLYQSKLNKPKEAKQDFESILSIDTLVNPSAKDWQIFALHALDRVDEAIIMANKLTLNSTNKWDFYNSTCLFSLANKPKDAIDNMTKSLELGYTDFIHADSDDDLDNIRELPEHLELLAKYRVPYEAMLNEKLGMVGVLVVPIGGM